MKPAKFAATLPARVSALVAESTRARAVHADHCDITPAAMLAFLKLAEPAIAALCEGTWVDLVEPTADTFLRWLAPVTPGVLRVRVATPGDSAEDLAGAEAEAAVRTLTCGADFYVWAEEVLARIEARVDEMDATQLAAEVRGMQALVDLAKAGAP